MAYNGQPPIARRKSDVFCSSKRSNNLAHIFRSFETDLTTGYINLLEIHGTTRNTQWPEPNQNFSRIDHQPDATSIW
jgi:hypothetical protein